MPSSTVTLSSTDLWAQPLGDTGGRFRECSPEWYRYRTVQYSVQCTIQCTVQYTVLYIYCIVHLLYSTIEYTAVQYSEVQ